MLLASRSGMLVDRHIQPEEDLPRSYLVVAIPSDDYDFRINFSGSDVVIKWGDGGTGTYTSSPASHTYAAGNYTIEIGDTCSRFECPLSYGRATITEVGFGQNVTSIADAGYYNATSLVKIACAPSVATAVNNTFKGCNALDSICDFPLLNIPSSRFDFLPTLSRVFSHVGKFSSQQEGNPVYTQLVSGAPVDHMTLLPALLTTRYTNYNLVNYYIRRVSFPVASTIMVDAFYGLPNLYGVYCPACSKISSCITRSSSLKNNNPLGVTHMRLGHLTTGYTPAYSRTLCWGGSENYLGVFMVDMTRAELSDWLSAMPVSNFISQSAFTQKAVCTDDPEWSDWDSWFSNGMEVSDAPAFPLNR